MEFTLGQLLPNHHRALKSLCQIRGQAQKLVAIRPKCLDEETWYYGPDQYAANFHDANSWFDKSYPVKSPPPDKMRRRHTYAILLRVDLMEDQCHSSSERGAPFNMGPTAQVPEKKAFCCVLNSRNVGWARWAEWAGWTGKHSMESTPHIREAKCVLFFCNHLEIINQSIKPWFARLSYIFQDSSTSHDLHLLTGEGHIVFDPELDKKAADHFAHARNGDKTLK